MDSLYTPLPQAIQKLEERRQDRALRARVESFQRAYPLHCVPSQPFAALLRWIATPNHEFDLFMHKVGKTELRPMYGEFCRDTFVSCNPDKLRLCKPAFTGPARRHDLRLVDFNGIERKSLAEIRTENGLALSAYHHALQFHAHPESGQYLFDYSAWVSPQPDYLSTFAPFICHGILFETFVAENPSELRFTREKILPSFLQAIELFGVRPLIVRLLPQESENDDHWRSHPFSLHAFAVELLRSKAR